MGRETNPQKWITIADVKRYVRGAFAGGTLLTMLAFSGGAVQALDYYEVINSFVTGCGQENAHIGAKNRANFSSDNHGSVLVGANLYLDSSSGGEELKIAMEHDSPYNTSLAGAAIHMPGHQRPRQGGIDFYARPPLDRPVAANEPYPNFPDSPSMSITAAIQGGAVVERVDTKGDLRVSGDIYTRGRIAAEKGEKGDTGSRGLAGQDGPDGRNGMNGRDGAAGSDGEPRWNQTVAACGQGINCGCLGTVVRRNPAPVAGSCSIQASVGSCSIMNAGTNGAVCCECRLP